MNILEIFVKNKYYWCLIIIAVIAFLAAKFYSALSILGPRNKPDFGNMDWVEIKIKYWIRKKDEKNFRMNKRIITIKDMALINELKSKFKIRNISGLSLATDDQILITMKDGRKWQGVIIFENEIELCLQSNNYYSYDIILSNDEFYQEILKLALKHEKKIHQNATEKNIVLRLNYFDNYETIIE